MAVLAVLSAAFSSATAAEAQPNLILQLGHLEEIVGTPSVTADGKLAASMDSGRIVIVWDMNTGQQLRRLVPGEEREGSMMVGTSSGKGSTALFAGLGQAAFSPDGKLLAATAQQGVTLWNVQDGRKLRELKLGSTNALIPRGIAFSPDSKRIVVPRTLGIGLVVFDLETGGTVYETGSLFSGAFSGTFPYDTVAWSPDGRFIIAASTTDCLKEVITGPDGYGARVCQVRVFDASDGSEVAAISAAGSFNRNTTFSPNGKLLFVYGKEGPVLLEVGSWRILKTLPKGTLGKPSFSPDGKWIAFSSKSVKLFDLTSDELPSQTIDLPFPAAGLAWHADSRSILVFGKRGSPQVVSLDRPTRVVRWKGNPPDAEAIQVPIAVDREGRYLAVASNTTGRSHIDLWDLRAGGLGRRYDLGKTEAKQTRQVGRVFFGPDGNWLGFAGALGVEIWDSQTERRKFNLPGNPDVSMTSDGRRLATAGNGVTVYEPHSGTRIAAFPKLEPGQKFPRFSRAAISPDGRWVAGHEDNGKAGGIRIWDIQSGQELNSRPASGGSALLQFDNSGLLYHAGDYSRIEPLSVWNVERGERARAPADISAIISNWTYDSPRFAICCDFMGQGEHRTRILDTASGKLSSLRDSRFIGGSVQSLALFPDGRYIAIAGSDGSVRILTQDTGELLITLLVIRDGNDWLAFTPDGLFDGTPGGWDALLWRFSEELHDVVPGEVFFGEFYRPGLLAEIIAGMRTKATRNLAEIDRRQPEVVLRVTGGSQRLARVSVEVQEVPAGGRYTNGSGVRDVRLFRNGSLVKYWKGEVTGGKAVLEADIPIVAGENRFSAYAFNRDNIKSSDARAIVAGADALKRPATAWVLAFGIDRYANSTFNLNFSVADAHAFSEQIGAGLTSLGHYQQIKLVTLRDGEATRGNLLGALRRLAGSDSGPLPKGSPRALAELNPAQPEDAVFIFFAGHGMVDGPRFYLVPHDLGYAGSAERLDAAARATILKHAVSDLELEDALERLDAERLVLAIDACHSGQALEAEERRRGPMNSKGLAQLAYEKGMYVITAAQSHQAALELGQLGHGLLTYALVNEGLGQSLADRQPRDGRIEVREWLDYASTRVPQLQLEAMRAAVERGRKVAIVRGEENEIDPFKRSLQQPRSFYRREPERSPFLVGGAAK